MRRIAVLNQKGGVGKTTTAVNLGVALSLKGQRVLLIDLDPQAHLTLHLGIDCDGQAPSSHTVLTQGQSISSARRRMHENLWVVPSQVDLAAAEAELVNVIGRETILRDALVGEDLEFDYLLIDCPPSLGILTLNGLCAADEVLIPMQAHFLALQGVGKLLETVQLVQCRINRELRVGSVLICMYESTTRLGGEVIQDLERFFLEARGGNTPWADTILFKSFIRRNIKLAESPGHGLSVFDYAPKSRGAEDYARLAEELLGMRGGVHSAPRISFPDGAEPCASGGGEEPANREAGSATPCEGAAEAKPAGQPDRSPPLANTA